MARLLPSRARADLFAQLAAMETAGLPPDRAWGLIKLAGIPAHAIATVHKAVACGANPAVAAQNAGLFTPLEGQLVRAALAAGSPAAMYHSLAQLRAEQAQNESAMRSRMMLPAVVLVLALFIQGLPQLVAGTLSAAGYLLQVVKPLLLLAAAWIVGKQCLRSATGQRSLLHVPLFGAAIARRNAVYFFESLALLLQAGVAMFEALPMALATIEAPAMRQAYARIKPSMQRGASLSQALEQQITEPGFLGPISVIEFVRTGEVSGSLPDMLLRHTRTEAQSLSLFWEQVAQWMPRIAYAAVACWMAYNLLSGAGVGPRMPADL